MKIGWILGWAIPEPWFASLVQRAFPDASHRFFAADRHAIARISAEPDVDRVCGYSLGAHLLLAAADRVPARAPIALLAPIFAFPRERGLGGVVSTMQLRYLMRWLKRDPKAALQDFYARAALDIPPECAPIAAVDDLAWGLETLLDGDAPPRLPPGWIALCGGRDPLLDPGRLQQLEPRIQIIDTGTHHPATILATLKRRFSPEQVFEPC